MSAADQGALLGDEQLPAHETGAVSSGDVEIFYRLFGEPGTTPLLILHGGNYYDSYDWIEIASALADGRQVAAYDARGFGESGWSPTENYSLDAQLSDISALLDHLGWDQATFVAHSRGTSFALRFAFEHPQRVAAMAVLDYLPGRPAGQSRRTPAATGPRGPIFESIAAAVTSSSRYQDVFDDPAKRARVEMIYAPVDGGWINVRRDPAYSNSKPTDPPDWTSRYPPMDLWDAVSSLQVPVLLIWATKSGIYNEERLAQFREHLPSLRITGVESGHDMASEAPAELLTALQDFV